MNLARIKISPKVTILIVIIALAIGGYFIYKEFFANTGVIVSSASDTYINSTKLGRLIDSINKENISFNTNINNEMLVNARDFSVEIYPSDSVGRSNPFLP